MDPMTAIDRLLRLVPTSCAIVLGAALAGCGQGGGGGGSLSQGAAGGASSSSGTREPRSMPGGAGQNPAPAAGASQAPSFDDDESVTDLAARPVLALALGDVDGDMDLDLVAAGSDATQLFLNQGDGSFEPVATNTGDARAVLFLDLSGDGALDLVVGKGSVGFAGVERGVPDRVFLGDGEGALADTEQKLGIGITTTLAAGDLDADEDLDIVAGELNGARVYFNDATALFTNSGQNFQPRRTGALALGDFDGDGALDLVDGSLGSPLVAGNQGADPAILWTNNGLGRYQLLQSIEKTRVRAFAVGDLDADGALDVAAGESVGLRILLNDGGELTTARILSVGGVRAVAIADVDGDADLDVVEGGDDGLRIVRSTGDGVGFTIESVSLRETLALALGDLDGDGVLEIVRGGEDGIQTLAVPAP